MHLYQCMNSVRPLILRVVGMEMVRELTKVPSVSEFCTSKYLNETRDKTIRESMDLNASLSARDVFGVEDNEARQHLLDIVTGWRRRCAGPYYTNKMVLAIAGVGAMTGD